MREQLGSDMDGLEMSRVTGVGNYAVWHTEGYLNVAQGNHLLVVWTFAEPAGDKPKREAAIELARKVSCSSASGQLRSCSPCVCVHGMWAFTLSLAASGDRTGFAAAAVFALVRGTLGNGLISLFIAPPPSLGFRYQDVTHFGSLIFGTLAALAAWKQVRRTPGRVRSHLPLVALLDMVPIGYVTGKVRT